MFTINRNSFDIPLESLSEDWVEWFLHDQLATNYVNDEASNIFNLLKHCALGSRNQVIRGTCK